MKKNKFSFKAEFHAHTNEDPQDDISLNAYEFIDYMSSLGYEVLTITNHDVVTYNEDLRSYADAKEILLIPGVEACIAGKHVLIINYKDYKKGEIETLEELKALKKDKNVLIIAPHPFYLESTCLKDEMENNIDVFDAIEYSHFYIKGLNLNKNAVKVSKKYGLPLVGTSDMHFNWQANNTYTFVAAKKNVESIIRAVKENNVKIVTNPLKLSQFAGMLLVILNLFLKKSFKRIFVLKKNV